MTLDRDRALRAAAGAVAALVLLRVAAFSTGFASWLDSAILQGFLDAQRPWLSRVAHAIAALADPLPFALLAVGLIAAALAAKRVRAAIVIPVVMLGANATTQLLKASLAHGRPADWLHSGAPLATNAWPSGHSTAAMSLALCAVLAAPAGRRVVTATLGGAFAVAVGFAVMTLDWHFPSDVLGGYLVALAWTLAGVAALRAGDRPVAAAERARDAAAALRVIAFACAGAAAVAFLAGPGNVLAYARSHTAFVLAAPALAALGLALTAGLAATLRR